MSKSITCPISENFNINAALEQLKTNLKAQGYEVEAIPMGESAASLNVSKDNDGFKKFVGLGVECTVTLTKMGNNTIMANVESSWTNKIIAFCIGWFLCWIPIITAIIGCINQSDLPKKITTVIQSTCANM